MLYHVKKEWHYSYPMGTLFVVQPRDILSEFLVNPVVPSAQWPRGGAIWPLYTVTTFLELAEGPW